MAYSTIAEVRANERILELIDDGSPDLTNLIVTARIVMADKIVEADLGKVVTFPLPGATPGYINLLSNYKATELSLVWLYTRKRKGLEEDDIEYWRGLYQDLLDKILAGEIDLGISGTGTGTYSWTSRENVEPALGTGKWGGFETLTELQEERPTD